MLLLIPKYKTMPTISIAFAAIAGAIHVIFFLMESVFWMNPKVHRGFGIKNVAEAEQFKLSFFNQGFYNLFIALGTLLGISFIFKGQVMLAGILISFCGFCMVGAGVVLWFSAPHLRRAAYAQMIPPLLGFFFLAFHI